MLITFLDFIFKKPIIKTLCHLKIFAQAKKEEQNKEREDQETLPEYTLKSILNNKERSDLLAGEIEKNGDTDLVNRLVNKQLTETDLGKLGDYREQFVEKIKAS